jgi:hypothetical protein
MLDFRIVQLIYFMHIEIRYLGYFRYSWAVFEIDNDSVDYIINTMGFLKDFIQL